MNYYLINFTVALWIESLVSLFFGIFVLIKGKETFHKLYAFASFSVSWWSFSEIWVIACDKPATALMWARIECIGIFFIPTFLLHFTLAFLRIKKRTLIIWLSYVISILSTGMSQTSFVIPGVAPKYYLKYYSEPGIAFHLFLIFFCISTIYTIWKLFSEYKIAIGERRNQIKYLFLSFSLGYACGSLNFLFAYDINVPFLPYITYLGSLWPWFTTYAIFRHKLLDINIVIKKTAVYSILVAFIGAVYFVLIFLTESFFRGFVGYKSPLWTLGVIVIFSLIFQPLKNLIQSMVDKHFFKNSPIVLAQKLERAQDELKRTERLKAVGTLAAGMAHEIKNPLTAIKTFAEYLPSKHNDPAFVDKFHKIVTSEVDRINSTVQQLLDFSKPKPLQLEECDIHKVIDNTLSLLNNDLIKYKIRLVRNYDPALPKLKIDPNQMQQVFCNLFLNAIDALKEGGELSIITKVYPHSGIAQITISDNGKGIAPKDLEHIFDPFYTTKETGTGLGMSIIYGIIKEHRGTIEVKSRENEGTEFDIKLSS